MAPASNDEQFKFLISCIRYSNNGKIDFTQVAKECGIVTKGAAAKRYERMMKAHGISPNGSTSTAAATSYPYPSRAKSLRQEPTGGNPRSKKRKMDTFVEDTNTGDDDEEYIGNSSVKTEIFKVEEEESMEGKAQKQLGMHDTANHPEFFDAASQFEGSQIGEAGEFSAGDFDGFDHGSQSSYTGQSHGYMRSAYEDVGDGMGMNGFGGLGIRGVPRWQKQGLGFQPMMGYPVDDGQGDADSPVVLE